MPQSATKTINLILSLTRRKDQAKNTSKTTINFINMSLKIIFLLIVSMYQEATWCFWGLPSITPILSSARPNKNHPKITHTNKKYKATLSISMLLPQNKFANKIWVTMNSAFTLTNPIKLLLRLIHKDIPRNSRRQEDDFSTFYL